MVVRWEDVVQRARLVLVDDHHLIVEGLKQDLGEGYEVVAVLDRGADVVEVCSRLRPDCILLDLGLPDRSGLEVILDLRASGIDARILVISMHNDEVLVETALANGANGFVSKCEGAVSLRQAVRDVLSGRTCVRGALRRHGSAEEPPDLLGVTKLSARQREILALIGEGRSSKSIAAQLSITEDTIAYHRAQMRRLLGLRSEWGLVRLAIVAKCRLAAP
jgi:DNA-binding NarL/FixJ family response regulator